MRAAEFWQIPAAEKDLARPVDFELTVTYYDPPWGLLWGLADGKPLFLPCSPEAPLAVHGGQQVRLRGTVLPQEGLSARRLQAEILSERVDLVPADINAHLDGLEAYEKQLVTVEGWVEHQQTQDSEHLVWQLRAGAQVIHARHYTRQPSLVPSAEGRRVRAQGVLITASSAKRREVQLWVSSRDDIQLLATEGPAPAPNPPPASAPPPDRPLRTLAELWDSAAAEKGRAVPASLELTILYYDPVWGLLWAESDRTPAFVPCFGPPLPVRSGQRVRLEGHVLPGRGIATDLVRTTVLQDAVELPAEPVAGRIADGNRFNRHLVVLEGLVDRQAEPDAHHVLWEIVSEGRAVSARMHCEDPKALPRLAGSIVRVRGVYSPKIDPSGVQFGLDLWVPGPGDIQPVTTLNRDPRFNLPPTPIENLGYAHGLVRVVGEVRSYESGRRLMLRDVTGHAELSILQAQPLRIGDRVEAIGFPDMKGLKRTLSAAVFRPFVATDPESVRLAGSPVELRSADRVLELPTDIAWQHRPVRLQGLVTWSHPRANFLFLQDSIRGVCVRFDSLEGPPPTPGSAVVVTGVTDVGSYAPFVSHPVFERRGEMILPQPPAVSTLQAMSGNLEAQWVEMQGYVSSVRDEGLWRRITLLGQTGEFTALVPADVELRPIVGSVVQVRGVCEAIANERRQLVGVQLWVIDPTYVRVEAAPPADPFSLPLQPVASLRQFSPFPVLNRWVHVRGVVSHHVAGQVLYLDDDGEGLAVDTHGGEAIAPGEWVDAVGLPGLEGRRAVLREAILQRQGRTTPPAVTPLARIQDVSASNDSRLVSLRGTLVSVLKQPGGLLLAVQKDGAVFNASLALPSGETAPDWIPRSEVRVTGICRVDYAPRSDVRGFEILLRSPDDVQVVSAPPWWTVGRVLASFLVLFGCVVLGFLWALSLRRRVRQQTALIRSQFAKEASLEAHNRNIVENASDFIFTASLDGRLTAFNPAGERITGYTREEALTLNLRDLIATEKDAADARNSLRPELGGRAAFQTRLKTRDGRFIWVEISSRFVSENGRRTGVLGIVRDISERKQFEDSLEKARDEAEASARAKSAFLANMSHEIRTPMNGVIGVTNLLLDTELDPEQRDYAETIRTSAESLLGVLNDILDFSKIEAGKLEFEKVPFDLAETVESAVDLLAERAATKHLELAVSVPAELPRRLVGDPGRIRQVLINLVSNAVKFTERGEVVVRVRSLDVTPEDARLVFDVTDTCIGLSPEDTARLFQPFTQADPSTTRRFGGTGLGLAICRQIAELMEGSLSVRSTKGQGSTFSLTARFPIAPPPADPAPAPTAESLAGKRALVVDDNPAAAEIVAQYLGSAGVCCHAVGSVREAAASLGAEPLWNPDVLLVDAGLADGGDLGPLAALAESGPARRPLVLLLPLDQHPTPHQLAPVRSARVVTKPAHRDELVEAVHHVLHPPSPAARPAPAAAPKPEAREPKLRALVVEDNSVNQRVARVVLEKMGFRVELAASGLEALEAVDRSSHDVVLMDCQMPEMDGYEATRRIRRGRHPHLRIIAMTANAMAGDRERCLEAGMDDYVSKPMRVEELRAALVRCKVLALASPS